MSLKLKTISKPIVNSQSVNDCGAAKLHRLDNGVTVIIDNMPTLKSACIGIWLGVGTRFEAEDNNGIAHFLEHLVFKGAGNRNAAQIAEDAESNGIYLNAATSYERTGFYARCLSVDIDLAFELCSDLVLRPHFNPKEAELERTVVLHEINETFDDAEDRCGVINQLAAFANQPLGRPILGDAETLASLKLPQIHEFHKNYLNPSNIVIAFGGAVNAEQALELANKHFGSLKPHPRSTFVKAISTNKSIFEYRNVEQFQLSLSSFAPQAGSNDMYAAQIFASILGGGMASRLFQDLREKLGLVYGIDAYAEKYFDIGRFIISAGCDPKNAAEVIKRTLGHLEDLAAHEPTEAELKRAKKTFETAFMMSLENPSARVNAAVSQAFVLGKTISTDNISLAIQETTGKEIQAIANKILEPKSRAASAVGKNNGEKSILQFLNV